MEAKDAEIAVLRAEAEAARERERRLELRLAELERRLGMDSTDSGTPSSRERIGAKEARRARQQSERERSKDRKRGGQPGHQGKGLKRDPDPGDRKTADPPAECRSCHGSLGGAEPAGEPRWAQVIDIEILRKATEVLLPGLACGDCGTVTYAAAPPGYRQGCVCYGPVLNAAAVLLSCFGNVPAERSARLIGMLTGQDVSSGWVDKAVARVNAGLEAAGFDEAMLAALAAEGVLAADETPVNVLDKTPLPGPGPGDAGEADPEETSAKPQHAAKAAAGVPHVLIVATPDGRLTFLQALGSRRKESVGGGIPAGLRRLPDDRRLRRLPAPHRHPRHGHPAVLPAHHPQGALGAGTRPRRRPELGRGHHHHPARRACGRRGRPCPRQHRPGPAGPR